MPGSAESMYTGCVETFGARQHQCITLSLLLPKCDSRPHFTVSRLKNCLSTHTETVVPPLKIMLLDPNRAFATHNLQLGFRRSKKFSTGASNAELASLLDLG